MAAIAKTMQPHNLERMAHSGSFSAMDTLWTINFLQSSGVNLSGERILDLCGGMSRCSDVYARMFEKVDVLDLQPEWGKLDQKKRGELIRCSLHQVKDKITPNKYDAIIGNWSLCYLAFEDLVSVLEVIRADGILKSLNELAY